MKKLYCVVCAQYRKFEKPKISYKKHQFFLLLLVHVKMKKKKYLKENNHLRYERFLV